MPEVSFASLLAVALIAFLAPFTLSLVPGLKLPAVVLEIVCGIAVGPHGFGWVDVDLPVRVLSVVGLAFLLFLAGLEIDLRRLRGTALHRSSIGFAVSVGLALAVGYGLDGAGLEKAPLLVAVALLATSLGVVVPVLKDAGEATSPFGQIVFAGASIADVASIVLLSLLFSKDSTGTGAKLVLLGGFALTLLAVAAGLAGIERVGFVSRALVRLQDTTAQIRVRGAFVLLAAFTALASSLGLEVILGSFAAGALLAAIDRDEMSTHPLLHLKLEATGFGVFIPIFFVTSGLTFNLHALVAHSSTLALVPVFALALLLVRGLPAVLYRPLVGDRRTVAAALLQATSLPFIVTATQIGVAIGVVDAATAAALVAAGLLSVLIFPLAALSMLGGGRGDSVVEAPAESATVETSA